MVSTAKGFTPLLDALYSNTSLTTLTLKVFQPASTTPFSIRRMLDLVKWMATLRRLTLEISGTWWLTRRGTSSITFSNETRGYETPQVVCRIIRSMRDMFLSFSTVSILLLDTWKSSQSNFRRCSIESRHSSWIGPCRHCSRRGEPLARGPRDPLRPYLLLHSSFAWLPSYSTRRASNHTRECCAHVAWSYEAKYLPWHSNQILTCFVSLSLNDSEVQHIVSYNILFIVIYEINRRV